VVDAAVIDGAAVVVGVVEVGATVDAPVVD
jgi:hypothetical protein